MKHDLESLIYEQLSEGIDLFPLWFAFLRLAQYQIQNPNDKFGAQSSFAQPAEFKCGRCMLVIAA